MNDDPEGDDLPIIDVRSPAERATDAGRAGLVRVQARFRRSHLDIAALLWMIFVIGLLAVEVYGAFRSADRFVAIADTKGWVKATLLAESGNSVIIFGSMIGVSLAAWTDSGRARGALVLAAAVGLWVVVAHIIGVAVVFHHSIAITFSYTGLSDNRGVAAIGELMFAGLGAVVVFVALGLLMAGRRGSQPKLEVAEPA